MSARHAPYVVLSLLILMTFVAVPPFLLLTPSLSRNLMIVKIRWPKYFRVIPNFAWHSFNWPKLTLFLEAFDGCYRNGTTSTSPNEGTPEFDYRWCAGFYLLLRVMIFFVSAFVPDTFTIYSFFQFFCIIGVLVFLLLRPYKDDFYNKLDASMFCLLLAINTLTMYSYNNAAIGLQPSLFVFIFQYILIFLPLIYISFVVIAYLRRCGKQQRHSIDDNGDKIVNREDELAIDYLPLFCGENWKDAWC